LHDEKALGLGRWQKGYQRRQALGYGRHIRPSDGVLKDSGNL
jgi:hypothetical protein